MADTKLSALTALAVEPADVDEFYINDGGVSKRITYATIKALFATAAQGTTANNALPKAGGQMSGNITMAAAETVDGRDLSADGTKLDAIEATADVTDEANVVSSLDGATIADIAIAVGDKVLLQDITASDALKTATALEIANLATPEGTVILSTGEVGGTKFLREDGDGTCSWQAAAGGGGGAFSADGDTQITPTTSIVLDQATGDEVALTVNYTTNKASSGADTGLLIAFTDTASPGVSLPFDYKLGGVSQVSIDSVGQLRLDKAQIYGTTTGIWFGDGDVGLYEQQDDSLRIKTGVYTWRIGDDAFSSPTGGGASITRAPGTVSLPTYSFASDLDTGMFKDGDDQLAFTAGGVEGMRIVEATTITITMSGAIISPNMPTSDPSVAGQLWANSGVINISTG